MHCQPNEELISGQQIIFYLLLIYLVSTGLTGKRFFIIHGWCGALSLTFQPLFLDSELNSKNSLRNGQYEIASVYFQSLFLQYDRERCVC